MATPAFIPQPQWQGPFLQLMNDLQFFAGRPEEAAFIHGLFAMIHHRRQWVEEREQFEADHHSH